MTFEEIQVGDYFRMLGTTKPEKIWQKIEPTRFEKFRYKDVRFGTFYYGTGMESVVLTDRYGKEL